jgi:hypothetical protein
MMKKALYRRLSGLVILGLAVCFILFFLTALSNLDSGKQLEDKSQLEDALHRAAVCCYAIEGAYPPDLAYLVENYGVQIDAGRFTVSYELYASNLMPDITVLDRPQ